VDSNKNEFLLENVFGDLVHYYEVRMSASSDFSTRTWHRFNWFMTMQLGAFAFIFSSMIKVPQSGWYPILTAFVAITALVWSLLGYEDFKHIKQHADECKEIERLFLGTLEERADIKLNLEKARHHISFIPFDHARILYLFPLSVFATWSALSIYLFVR